MRVPHPLEVAIGIAMHLDGVVDPDEVDHNPYTERVKRVAAECLGAQELVKRAAVGVIFHEIRNLKDKPQG